MNVCDEGEEQIRWKEEREDEMKMKQMRWWKEERD